MAGLPNDGTLYSVLSSSKHRNSLTKFLAVFGTIDQEHHHRRRTAINSVFSRKSVQKVEPILHRFLDILCNKLQAHLSNDGVVRINMAILSLTTDTIGQYGFDKSFGLLEDDDKAMNWYQTNKALAKMIPTVRQFPWSMPLALRLPVSVVRMVNVDLARVLELRHVCVNLHASGR